MAFRGRGAAWQGGALQEKFVGANAGGTLRWYLCRDAETGELGIECESIGGGDFSGGVLLRFGDIEVNCTLDMLLSRHREAGGEAAVYRILFPA